LAYSDSELIFKQRIS